MICITIQISGRGIDSLILDSNSVGRGEITTYEREISNKFRVFVDELGKELIASKPPDVIVEASQIVRPNTKEYGT